MLLVREQVLVTFICYGDFNVDKYYMVKMEY